MSEEIICEVNDHGVAKIRLNRPEKLNALSLKMIAELTEAAKQITTWSLDNKARICILESTASKAFCVGADLTERKKMSHDEVVETLDKQLDMMNAVAAIPIPVIAAVEGYAFGGGLELALCADLRVLSKEARVGLTECKLAIIPGAGGTQRLARLIGESKAKELIFCARKLTADEAYKYGIVNAVTTSVTKLISEWTHSILACGPLALKAAKKSIEQGLLVSNWQEAFAIERDCYLTTLKSSDRLEGLSAFAEKRPPEYKGK